MDQGGLFVADVGVHDGLVVTAGDVTGRVFKHELAHALSLQYGLPPTAPVWLWEGIACYLVTQRPWTPPLVTPTRRTLPDADAHAARRC